MIKLDKTIEEKLKPQREINSIVVTIIAAIIPIILTVSGRLAYDIALLLVITILFIYLGWIFSHRKKSIIDWNLFYNMLVIKKAQFEYTSSIVKGTTHEGPAYDKLISDEVYNNYITYLYLSALYEGKDKFAQELWDKARILDKSVDVEEK